MKLRHTGITVIKQQLEFRYFIDKYVVLNFTILIFAFPLFREC